MTDHPRRASARMHEHDLTVLRWHWGEVYEFTEASGSFTATRRDTGRSLTARSVGWLWELVRADYLASPVPRLP